MVRAGDPPPARAPPAGDTQEELQAREWLADELERNFEWQEGSAPTRKNVFGNFRLRRGPLWPRIVRSKVVMAWINEGVYPTWRTTGPKRGPPPPRRIPNSPTGKANEQFVDEAVAALTLSGAVRVWDVETEGGLPHVVSGLLVAARADGKLRLCHALCYVNEYLWWPKFKYESLDVLKFLLEPGMYLFKFDMEAGYHHVDMHPAFHTFLGFEWRGVFYVFRVLPFGLGPACQIFTKLFRELHGHWRGQGIRTVHYLDDGLAGIHATHAWDAAAVALRAAMVRDLTLCNVLISEKKWDAAWALWIVFLGTGVDTADGVFFNSEKRWKDLCEARDVLLAAASAGTSVRVKQLARFAGLAMCCRRAMGPVVQLFTRASYSLVNATVGDPPQWRRRVRIEGGVLEELRFWTTIDRLEFREPIWPRPAAPADVRGAVDASDFGWGGHLLDDLQSGRPLRDWRPLGEVEARGFLTMFERGESSTYRELCGLQSFLESTVHWVRNSFFQVYVDNMGVTSIVKKGSPKPLCQEKALAIFRFCRRHNIQLSVLWVPREENVRADYLSKTHDTSDWKLNQCVKDADLEMPRPRGRGWGKHTFDRFASHLNKTCDLFNSAWWCPGSSGVDCFVQLNWHAHNNWCNPPFNLIGLLVRFLMREGVRRVTIIVPVWQKQAWWPLVCPDGVHFAPWVVDWVELSRSRDLFMPGQGRANEEGVGLPDFRVLALRGDFASSFVLPLPRRCLRGGCYDCRGAPFKWFPANAPL